MAMVVAGARDRQHRVNFGVLIVSALAAWWAPLPTFLLAYAVIGPFHYLTEIAWLRKKNYYFTHGVVAPRVFLWVAITMCGVGCLDLYFKRGWAAYAVGVLLVLSLGALVRRWIVLAGALVLLGLIRFFVHGYGLFLALFVPTVLHVYVFTALFLFSALARVKRQSRLGWINAALLLGLPLALWAWGWGSGGFNGARPGAYWMASEALFVPMHQYLAGFAGLGLHFNPASAPDAGTVAIFRVLAFIYLHHYLNWFAKTELLEWHRMSGRSWGVVAVLYAAALGSYAYRFAAGFYAAYFLSLLHVLLELPLDWHAGASLVREPWERWRARQVAEAGIGV